MKTLFGASLAILAFVSTLNAAEDQPDQEIIQERPSLHVAEFDVTDAQSGEPVNVAATLVANTPGSSVSIALYEMKPRGPYRVTWIGDGSSDWSLELSAEGYETITIQTDQVETVTGKTTIAGRRGPINLTMDRAN